MQHSFIQIPSEAFFLDMVSSFLFFNSPLQSLTYNSFPNTTKQSKPYPSQLAYFNQPTGRQIQHSIQANHSAGPPAEKRPGVTSSPLPRGSNFRILSRLSHVGLLSIATSWPTNNCSFYRALAKYKTRAWPVQPRGPNIGSGSASSPCKVANSAFLETHLPSEIYLDSRRETGGTHRNYSKIRTLGNHLSMLDWLTLPRLRVPRPRLAMDYDDAEERLVKTSAKRSNNEPGGSFRKWNTIDVCWLFILVICMIYAMITVAVHNFSKCPEFCRSEEYCRDPDNALMWIGGSVTSANSSWYRCACSGTASCNTTELATGTSNDVHNGMEKRELEMPKASAVSIPSYAGDSSVSAAKESPMRSAQALSAGTSHIGITGEPTTFITTAKPRWTNSTSADATSSGAGLPMGTVSIGPKQFPNATGVAISGIGFLNSSFAPVEKSYKHACDFKKKYTCGPFNVQGAGTGDVIRQFGDVSDGVCTCYCTPLDGVKDAIFNTAFDKACDYFSTAWIGTDFSQVLFHNYNYGYGMSDLLASHWCNSLTLLQCQETGNRQSSAKSNTGARTRACKTTALRPKSTRPLASRLSLLS